jgi:hypothetical protein
MTDTSMPPSTGEAKLEDALAHDRVETDPEREPSAPNRDHQPEFVRKDLKDNARLDTASDNDELDQPDR